METNLNRKLMVLVILILIVIFFAYRGSFKDDVPDCDGYVTNVYLYTLLGLLITAFAVLFIAKRRFAITGTKSLIAFIVALVALFSIFAVEPQQVLLNHFLWLIFILAISVSVYSIWRYSKYRGTLNTSLIAVVILTSLLTLIAHLKPEWIQLGWGSTLTMALLAGLFAWLIPMFFAEPGEMSTYYRVLSGIFIFIFMAFILYDTKLLRVKAEQCTIPDYPKDSLGLFLDVVNLFGNLVMFQR